MEYPGSRNTPRSPFSVLYVRALARLRGGRPSFQVVVSTLVSMTAPCRSVHVGEASGTLGDRRRRCVYPIEEGNQLGAPLS